jgi:hypothetical protein
MEETMARDGTTKINLVQLDEWPEGWSEKTLGALGGPPTAFVGPAGWPSSTTQTVMFARETSREDVLATVAIAIDQSRGIWERPETELTTGIMDRGIDS